ncbi:MAG TPA: TIGR03936 family radical SAM-associated protein [Acidimicrobiia bacterium]|nr:TIGR03936 family radical SAM-associated protein [Acidimicrobiia bacterium]
MRGDAFVAVRLRFAKRGRVRFVSHRDVARAFERAFRVVRLPLAFTEGFAPRPRMSLGPALPLGFESDAEYLDVGLTEEVDLEALSDAVSSALPDGIDVTGAAVLEPRARSLQEAIVSATYTVEAVTPDGGPAPAVEDVEAWVSEVLAAEELRAVRRRKGREVEEDLRPAIRTLLVVGATSEGVEVELEVSTQPRGVRPGEVLSVLGPGLVEARVLRTGQWIERDGSRFTPLEADMRSRAEVRA